MLPHLRAGHPGWLKSESFMRSCPAVNSLVDFLACLASCTTGPAPMSTDTDTVTYTTPKDTEISPYVDLAIPL